MTGRPVHVAVIDSGVSLPHPHIRTIAAGVTIAANGATSPNYFDRLGHGTAVADVTGLLARHLPANGRGSVTTAIEVLRQVQSEFSASDRSSGEPSP